MKALQQLQRPPTALMAFGLVLAPSLSMAASGEESVELIKINFGMFILFLLTFMFAAFLLNKFAFGPILAGLDARDERITSSIENAEKVEQEMAEIDTKRATIIDGADEQAKSILDEARKGGNELKRVMEEEGKEEARIMRENAEREIRSAEEKARADLKLESADMAVQLARQVLGEELKTNGDAFVNKLIKEL